MNDIPLAARLLMGIGILLGTVSALYSTLSEPVTTMTFLIQMPELFIKTVLFGFIWSILLAVSIEIVRDIRDILKRGLGSL